MGGTCTTVNTAGNIIAPTATGACYTLTFPAATVDFSATVDTTGVANVAFFAEHVPTEFERDKHYFLSNDMATDIEPLAQTPFPCVPTSPTAAQATCAYADATMKVVAYAFTDNLKVSLDAKKDAADTLMSTGTCTAITATCTPADASCTKATITPTTAGACYTMTFPGDVTKDFP